MAQWYNGVFYTEAEEPKKDDDFIPHSIPRIQEYDIENIEEIALASKFDFAFVDKFSFKGLPEDLAGQQKFLEDHAKTREVNPAGLNENTLRFQQTRNTINAMKSAIGTTAIHYYTGATNWLSSFFPTTAKITRGGRKTKKTRSQKNQKRTQRRLLAVVDDR